MKITIYELLGMVKNGKAPERILYDNYIWSWTGDDYHTILKNKKEQFLITGMYYTWLTEFLNDEVEIVEEEKKIPEKITINDNGTIGFPNGEWTARNMDKAFAIKFNQLIDYLESKGE